MKKGMVYKISRGAVAGIVLGLIFGFAIPTVKHLKKQDEYNRQLFRFHVRANSNRDEDIELKLKVRDALLEYIEAEVNNELGDEYTLEDMESLIGSHLAELVDVAEETVRNEGYSYKVNTYVADEYFPMRQYGELVIPAGNYEALRVDIGSAKGENFWCLLYPRLCYTIDSGAVVSREDGKEVEKALTDSDYEKLFVKQRVTPGKVKVGLRIGKIFR